MRIGTLYITQETFDDRRWKACVESSAGDSLLHYGETKSEALIGLANMLDASEIGACALAYEAFCANSKLKTVAARQQAFAEWMSERSKA